LHREPGYPVGLVDGIERSVPKGLLHL
jgi:hypothetical protein